MTWIKDTGSSGATNYIWNKDSPSAANGDIWLEYDAAEDLLTLNCRQPPSATLMHRIDAVLALGEKLRDRQPVGRRRRAVGQRAAARGHHRVQPGPDQHPAALVHGRSGHPDGGHDRAARRVRDLEPRAHATEIISLSQYTASPTVNPMSATIDEGEAVTFDVRANSKWAGTPATAAVTVSADDITYGSCGEPDASGRTRRRSMRAPAS